MKKTSNPIERYLMLFAPWALASLLQSQPVISYLVAWLGSFLIFFMVFSGWVKPLPDDRSIPEQVMRPVFLVQIIFVGYMACTSIFYFFNLLGYEDFHKANELYTNIDNQQLTLTAACQRYYVLGHAALASGLLIFMNYPIKQKYYIQQEKLANLLMIMAFIAMPLSLFFLRTPGLQQFFFQFSSLSFMAGTLALAFAIPLKKIFNTILCFVLYVSNLYQALLSGFKEPIILSVLILGIFLYPSYKKLVLVIFVPALIALFMLLPTFNTVFRQNAWSGDVNSEDAYKVALDATLNTDDPDAKDETTWSFLVYRLSEIDMFTRYIQSTPSYIDFYKFQLLRQSASVLIPRFFWPNKPSTEDLVMERVYDAGITGRGSNVSAKPAFVVDSYLSYGGLGIVIALFAYGAIAQLISMKAEYLFGGYTLGTALIFSGLFQIFWRGLSYEFIVNSVFWSYLSMLVLSWILRTSGILKVI